MRVEHTLEPVYSKHSKVLILGSMPSVTSREVGKYYAHKTNRFWKIMEYIYNTKIDDWQEFIISHDLALWDVISSCEITGSSDASIKSVIPNDIKSLLDKTNIKKIYLLGKSAYTLYNKYIYPQTKIDGIYLPSPSSANASISFDYLCELYQVIKYY